jgi:hypothetical protein
MQARCRAVGRWIARAAMLGVVGMAVLVGCSTGGGSQSTGRLWELRTPLALPGRDGRSVRAVYQVFPSVPVHDVLVRFDGAVIGLTLRARIPSGPLIAVGWPFLCVEIPLPTRVEKPLIVDDSEHRYPGSHSGVDDATARERAREILDQASTCPRLSPDRVRVR